jgi:hypothetical protein
MKSPKIQYEPTIPNGVARKLPKREDFWFPMLGNGQFPASITPVNATNVSDATGTYDQAQTSMIKLRLRAGELLQNMSVPDIGNLGVWSVTGTYP